MTNLKFHALAAALAFAASLAALPVLTVAKAEGAKHAINTKGTGGNKGKAACPDGDAVRSSVQSDECSTKKDTSRAINESGVSYYPEKRKGK